MIIQEELLLTGNVRQDIYNIRNAFVKLITDIQSTFAQADARIDADEKNMSNIKEFVLNEAAKLTVTNADIAGIKSEIEDIKSGMASLQEQIQMLWTAINQR